MGSRDAACLQTLTFGVALLTWIFGCYAKRLQVGAFFFFYFFASLVVYKLTFSVFEGESCVAWGLFENGPQKKMVGQIGYLTDTWILDLYTCKRMLTWMLLPIH